MSTDTSDRQLGVIILTREMEMTFESLEAEIEALKAEVEKLERRWITRRE
jgi:hypothetical protein